MCIRNEYVSVAVNVPAVTSRYRGTREYARFITVREISKVTRNKRRQRHMHVNIKARWHHNHERQVVCRTVSIHKLQLIAFRFTCAPIQSRRRPVCQNSWLQKLLVLKTHSLLLAVLGALKILRNATINFLVSVCSSVRPSACNNSAPTGWIFMKFDI
jgi:hypothetical protein